MRHFGRGASLLLVIAAGALIAVTCASADPAVATSSKITWGGFNTCRGEAFDGTGTLHFLLSNNLSASGAISSDLESWIDGLTAVTVTGQKYVANTLDRDQFTISGAAQFSFDSVAHFVRVGEDGNPVLGDDFYEFLRTHVTVNANGVITDFSVDTSDQPCQ